MARLLLVVLVTFALSAQLVRLSDARLHRAFASSRSSSKVSAATDPAAGGKTSKDYDGCIPEIIIIPDRTGSMTKDKTDTMLKAINEFFAKLKVDTFQYIETANRLQGPLTGPSAKEKPDFDAGKLDKIKCTKKAGSGGKLSFTVDHGAGFTDILTPLQLAAEASRAEPKFVVLLTDEMNNRYVPGITTGAKYLEAWQKAVADINKGGGTFRLLLIGSYDPAAKVEKYANPKVGEKDTGDYKSFADAYTTILASDYVIKGDTVLAAFQNVLQNMESEVYFASASGNLQEGEKARVLAKAKCCVGPVNVSCHTSKCGSDEVNLKLRQARCEQVSAALEANGFKKDQLTTEFAKSVYKCQEKGDGCAGEALGDCAKVNRRVTVKCSYVTTKVK